MRSPFLASLSGRQTKSIVTSWEVILRSVLSVVIERFSIEYRKTKTKVIILTNHNKRKQQNGPIGTGSKYR